MDVDVSPAGRDKSDAVNDEKVRQEPDRVFGHEAMGSCGVCGITDFIDEIEFTLEYPLGDRFFKLSCLRLTEAEVDEYHKCPSRVHGYFNYTVLRHFSRKHGKSLR